MSIFASSKDDENNIRHMVMIALKRFIPDKFLIAIVLLPETMSVADVASKATSPVDRLFIYKITYLINI